MTTPFYTIFKVVYVSLWMATRLTGSAITVPTIDSINSLPYEVKTSNTSKYVSVFQKNAAAAKSLGYRKGEADCYANLGLLYSFQGKYDLTTSYMLRAIRCYQSLGLQAELSAAYAEYGYQLKKRNLNLGVYYMQRGIQIAEKHQDEYRLSGMYDNYGVLKEMQSQWDSALYFYNKAMKIKRKRKDINGIPYSANKVALLQLKQGKTLEAKKLLDEAYALRKRLNDLYGIAENLFFYGLYFKKTGQSSRAIAYFQQAAIWSKKYQFPNLTQNNYFELAGVYETNSDYKNALTSFKNHVLYKDSIFNLQISAKQQELDTEYDTERKERQILLQRAQLAEKNNWIIGGFSLATVVLLMGLLFYNKQQQKTVQLLKENQLKDALLKIETQNKLQEQRLRISRDLHDNIGSQLTFIISSLDNLKYGFQLQDEKLEHKINTISGFTRDTIYELRDTIWAMNKEQVALEDLEMRIRNYVEKAEIASEQIAFNFEKEGIENQLSFSSVQGMNIYRIVQEAVHNAIKYAHAQQITVKVTYETDHIVFTVTDNGIGFDNEAIVLGNGILNMKKRAAEIQSQLTVHSLPQYGTTITLKVIHAVPYQT